MKKVMFLECVLYCVITTHICVQSPLVLAQKTSDSQPSLELSHLAKGLKTLVQDGSWSDEAALVLLQQYLQSSEPQGKGLKLFQSGFSQLTQGRFKQVSPAFLEHIDSLTNDQLKPFIKPLLEDHILLSRISSYWISYQFLETYAEWLKESTLYQYSLMNDSFFEGTEHIKLRFKDRIRQWIKSIQSDQSRTHKDFVSTMGDVSSSTNDLINDIEFWVKREIDGSRHSLYRLLQKIIYDRHQDWNRTPQDHVIPMGQSAYNDQELTFFYEAAYDQMTEQDMRIYLGDLFGLLKKISFNPKIHRMLKIKEHDIEWKNVWLQLSGIDVERSLEEHEQKRPFLFINPVFVFWLIDQLIPSPQHIKSHMMVRSLYQKVYRRLFNVLYESRLYLYQKLDTKVEKMEYAFARLSPQFQERVYLANRYGKILNSTYPEKGKEIFQVSDAIGFWLQREIDGTSSYLWSGLIYLRRVFREKTRKY